MDLQKRLNYILEGIEEPVVTTLAEAKAKIRWISEQPETSDIWMKITNAGIRYRNTMRNLISDLQ